MVRTTEVFRMFRYGRPITLFWSSQTNELLPNGNVLSVYPVPLIANISAFNITRHTHSKVMFSFSFQVITHGTQDWHSAILILVSKSLLSTFTHNTSRTPDCCLRDGDYTTPGINSLT